MDKIQELKELIEEYEDLQEELGEMADDWDSDDEEAIACSDPGLQFAKELEIEAVYNSIKQLAEEL